MDGAIRDVKELLASMEPVLNDGVYGFATLSSDSTLPLPHMVAMVREPEGVSVVAETSLLAQHGIPSRFQAAWITLKVHSDLAAVGLTAAFAAALGEAGISCNVVAGHCHDHIFIPHEQAEAAMRCLKALQQQAAEAV